MLMVITKDLSCSQLNYEIFQQLNKLIKTKPVALVYKNLTKNFYPIKFPLLNYSKIFSGSLKEDTTIIATDIDSALSLSQVKNKARKIFYVWELEFLKRKSYFINYQVYNSMEVYTRSQSYKQALDNYANINANVQDFKLESLWTRNIS